VRHLLTLRIGAKDGRFGWIAAAPRAASPVVLDRAIYRMTKDLFMDIGGKPHDAKGRTNLRGDTAFLYLHRSLDI
jgi:hypothetical protein